MNRKIGIIGRDCNSASDFLDWMTRYGLVRLNDTYTLMISSIEYSQSTKFNQLFIDIDVDLEYINDIAKPLIEISDNIPKENRIIYFCRHSQKFSLYRMVDCV